MDHFHFINVKPSIERKDSASIKDAIFRRAKEKANSLAEEKSENYSSQVQNDVMELARESIKSSDKNPFNQFIDSVGVKKTDSPENKLQNEEIAKLEETYTKEIKRNIEKVSNKVYENSVKEETMREARNQFRQGTNLMATLNFLNTQAAIKMAKNAHSKIRLTG